MNYRIVCEVIGKSPAENTILPMSGHDFLQYLDKLGILNEPAGRYIYHIRHLLDRMASSNILVDMGSSDANLVMIPKSYYALSEVSNIRAQGSLWLARALGGRFVHHQASPSIVQITGKTTRGDARAGSGVVFDPHHILTCKHVVTSMEVDGTQKFQGREFTVNQGSIYKSETADIAVIRVDAPMRPVPGLAFLAPIVAQTVYTFGYPKIPNVRPRLPNTDEAYLVMQSGEVTNEHVVASDGAELFLYSAISRPGNSGGAIVSDDGYVVGIVTELTDGRYDGEDVFSPHYAGIPAHAIANAIREMGLDVDIPYETFD